MKSDIDYKFYSREHFDARKKRLCKKHKDEVSFSISNFFKAMEFFQNANVEQLRRSGLVRRENNGILAVDQQGSKTRPPCEIRLYFFPWEDEYGKHCMVFTIGDKSSQTRDNLFCSEGLKKEHLK